MTSIFCSFFSLQDNRKKEKRERGQQAVGKNSLARTARILVYGLPLIDHTTTLRFSDSLHEHHSFGRHLIDDPEDTAIKISYHLIGDFDDSVLFGHLFEKKKPKIAIGPSFKV